MSSRDGLLQELNTLGCQINGYKSQPGNVAAWMSKALDQTHLNGIAAADKHDWDFVGRFSGSQCLRRANREDDVDAILNELAGELRKTLFPSFRIARLNKKVLAFYIAKPAKSLPKCRKKVWAA